MSTRMPNVHWPKKRFKCSGRTRTGRRIHTMKRVTMKEIQEFASPVKEVLQRSMVRPAFQVAQIISAPPWAPVQEVHRDHDLGPGKLFTLVVHRFGAPINTLFDRSSQNEEHRVLYRNKERCKMNVERLQRMRACENEGAVMYDAYIMHAGAPNATAEECFDRLFVTFIDAALEPHELDHLNEISFLKPSFREYVGCVRQAELSKALFSSICGGARHVSSPTRDFGRRSSRWTM